MSSLATGTPLKYKGIGNMNTYSLVSARFPVTIRRVSAPLWGS